MLCYLLPYAMFEPGSNLLRKKYRFFILLERGIFPIASFVWTFTKKIYCTSTPRDVVPCFTAKSRNVTAYDYRKLLFFHC